MDFEEICHVYGKHVPKFASPEYERMMAQVLPSSSKKLELPWNQIMPRATFEKAEKAYNAEVERILLEIGDDIDYLQIYEKTKSVFEYLAPAKIDPIRHKLYTLDNENRQYLEGFVPDKYGFLPVPKYNLSDTVTGRMKVSSGPNILLLPRKLRDVIQSRHGKNGSIWYLDYTSLEPRVILSVRSYLGIGVLIGDLPLAEILETPKEKIEQLPRDIYSDALKKLKLSSEITRDSLKQIVLPQIYGQAKSLTIDSLDSKGVRDPDEVVDLVNDFFGIDAMRSYVTQEFAKTGNRYLRTFYRRHVAPADSMGHALLNYYAQTSAVTVALLGFEKICRRLSETPSAKEVITPIFVLHDALILDVRNDIEHLIPKLCTLGSRDIPGFKGQTFWLSGNKL